MRTFNKQKNMWWMNETNWGDDTEWVKSGKIKEVDEIEISGNFWGYSYEPMEPVTKEQLDSLTEPSTGNPSKYASTFTNKLKYDTKNKNKQ